MPLTQGQFDALVDFCFNLGAGRLASSTLLKALNGGRYEAAAEQLLRWDVAAGQGKCRAESAPGGGVCALEWRQGGEGGRMRRRKFRDWRNGIGSGRFRDFQPFLRLEVAFAPEPIFHGGLEPVEGYAVADFEQSIGDGERVVEDGIVGEVAHGEVVDLADGAGVTLAGASMRWMERRRANMV